MSAPRSSSASLVPTVRLGTNLRHALSARRCDARSQLVEATDLDFSRSVFCLAGMCERRAPSTFFSRDALDESLIFSPSLNDLPDLLTMSE